MYRMGCYSGKFYPVNIYKDGVDECCIMIPDKVYKDMRQMQHLKSQLAKRCEHCNGCPMSRRFTRAGKI